MLEGRPHRARIQGESGPERGSALVMAIFVLAFLTGVGIALAFLAQTEVKMNQGDLRLKKIFYLAEAGLERGRENLRLANLDSGTRSLDDELVAAAGADGTMDFDPAALRPVFSGGEFVELTGYGDDVPLVEPTALGDGWYAAFLTNDPDDIISDDEDDPPSPLADTNDRVMITAVGIGRLGTFQVVQATVDPSSYLPSLPPATITLLGPSPEYEESSDGIGWSGSGCPGGSGAGVGRVFDGTDCGGDGIPNRFAPTIGAVGDDAVLAVEDAMTASAAMPTYVSNTYTDLATVADLTDPSEPTVAGAGLGALAPDWKSCSALTDMIARLRIVADTHCAGDNCDLPGGLDARSVTFIDGNFRVPCAQHGRGLLVVTGKLDFPATASWDGMILVIGEGRFYRIGSGNPGHGQISGAVVVADVAGPDDEFGTEDDCTGGTDGFDSAAFHEVDDDRVDEMVYCTADLDSANPDLRAPLEVTGFRHR